MTNYEKIMSEMTIEVLAVRLIKTKGRKYINHVGTWKLVSDAIKSEIEWLKSEVEHE